MEVDYCAPLDSERANRPPSRPHWSLFSPTCALWFSDHSLGPIPGSVLVSHPDEHSPGNWSFKAFCFPKHKTVFLRCSSPCTVSCSFSGKHSQTKPKAFALSSLPHISLLKKNRPPKTFWLIDGRSRGFLWSLPC